MNCEYFNTQLTTVHRLQQTENNAQNAALLLSAHSHAHTYTQKHTHSRSHSWQQQERIFIVVAAGEQQIIQTIQTDTHTHRLYMSSAATEQQSNGNCALQNAKRQRHRDAETMKQTMTDQQKLPSLWSESQNKC